MSSTSFGRRATSLQALAAGVRRTGKVDGPAVAHALRTGDPVPTVFGPVTFDAKGDAGGMAYEMNFGTLGATGSSPEASQAAAAA
jgi:hypothetical protein